MKATIKKILLLIFVLAAALAFVFHFDEYLTFAHFKANRQHLQDFVAAHYVYAVLLYIGIYTLLVSFALPTGGLLTLAGGFLFGALQGTIYAVISATAGATAAFLMTRYLLVDYVERRYPRYAQRLNKEIARYGYNYMLVLRLITFVPFFLINLVAGVTRLSAITFIWTTALGIIPATAAFAFAGQQLATIDSMKDIISYKLMLSFSLLALIASIPMLFGRLIMKKFKKAG